MAGIGQQQVVAAQLQLQRRVIAAPIQLTIELQHACSCAHLAVDACAAIGLRKQLHVTLVQTDAQRGEFGGKLLQACLPTQQRFHAGAGQLHIHMQIAGG